MPDDTGQKADYYDTGLFWRRVRSVRSQGRWMYSEAESERLGAFVMDRGSE